MKYVKPLLPTEIVTLKEAYKNAPIHRMRQRAHIILMSNNMMNIRTIAISVGLDRDTISSTIDAWESIGIRGLYDNQRTGRPPIYNEDEQKIINSLVKKEPKQLKICLSEIESKTGKISSVDTIKRVIKRSGRRWKRIKKVAGKPDPQEYKLKKKEIEKLNQRSDSGEIDLYFGDESGFSLVPVVPYAWQPVGETIQIKSSLSKRINVLGFLSKNKDFKCITLEGSVNSDCIISAIDALFVDTKKETWLVLDNAPVHRSKDFKSKIDEWKRNNINILFLPTYSPELNPIEILWRFIKYQWMPFSAYSSFVNLNSTLNHILANIGTKYNVTFA